MLPEKLIEHYTLIREYAQGGQSQTFLVQKDDIQYIVKVPKSSNLSKERKFRLEREIKALQIMNGDGVPKLFDFSIDDEVFILMEYVPGPTFQEYVEKYSFTLEEGANLILSITAIVEKAHNLGLIHRDLKPDNVIISDYDGSPVIIDFGICWMNDDESFKTKKGVELGNRFLRLPELAKGTDVTVSASDITFLVGLLFFIITKRHPYLLLDENGEMPHYRAGVKDLELLSHKRLKQIFDKGFTHEVNLRYQTANELNTDLTNVRIETEEIKDGSASRKLEEIFNNDFYKKKDLNIEILKKCHQEFLQCYNQKILILLLYGGSGPNYNENTRTVETRMFLIRSNSTGPKVDFYLLSQFDENFDRVTSVYGTENFNGEQTHTTKEITKISTLYPEIAELIAEKSMDELYPKIKATLE